MKIIKIYLITIIFAAATTLSFTSCRKGTDDPVVSLKTRKDRFTNTWTLGKYEKNGVDQNISGTTYTYDALNSGVLTQTIEGAIFGYPVKNTQNGTWEFLNDDEDVKIIVGTTTDIYNIQRLATKELWLKKTDAENTYIYYFNGK